MEFKFGTFEHALAGRYQFEEELGRGAMGTVYRARDVKLGRPVAIKMLHPALTNELGVGRFESEIRIAARLHHQNIIAVHESGEVDGRLFYVMDYFGGETLRQRLKRDKQLSVEDAIRITEQVADGLQHAHDHSVVHRDIKPENIILAEGQARIVDFGIAIALGSVDEDRLTATGLSVGTPHYISPEQAAAERDVGPQADQYALACVLFEMLAGEPPFTGPAASIIRRHITETPPRLRARRGTTPYAVEEAVARALHKVPADRFSTAQSFASALTALGSEGRPWRVLAGAAALILVVALAVWLSLDSVTQPRDLIAKVFRPALDTTRYVIIPFRKPAAVTTNLHESEILYDALARWDGVRTVELYQVQDAVQRLGTTPLTSAIAARIARRFGAGRYIWGEVQQLGARVRVRATAHDSYRPMDSIGEATVVVNEGESADTLLSRAADSLLFGRRRPSSADDAGVGTKSRPARQAFLQGLDATTSWNLAQADSAFRTATMFDPGYARAYLWLAQVRAWSRTRPPGLALLAAKAAADMSRLPSHERRHAEALNALAAGDYAKACAAYEAIVLADSSSFAGWYGIGDCNAQDDAVIRGVNGWQFRTSYRRGLEGYERAFTLLPSLHKSFSARAYSRLQSVFRTTSGELRWGHALAPDTLRFWAYPAWEGDTLAFRPILHRDLATNKAVPASHAEAINRQRRLLNRLAAGWASSLPGDPSALEALAVAMELLDDRAALDTIRRARAVATEPSQALRLAARAVWLQVKYSVPDSVRALEGARALADSLLRHTRPQTRSDASILLNLATLVGDAVIANRLMPLVTNATNPRIPAPLDVLRSGAALDIAAWLEAPPQELRRLGADVEQRITDAVEPKNRRAVRQELLLRVAMQSFPAYRPAALDSADRASDPLLAAQDAYLRGDKQYARTLLDSIGRGRAELLPRDQTLDALVPEAVLLAYLGDTDAAIARIDPTLRALGSIGPSYLNDAVLAPSVVRAMYLRAALARCNGDTAASERWMGAANRLWGKSPRQARVTLYEQTCKMAS